MNDILEQYRREEAVRREEASARAWERLLKMESRTTGLREAWLEATSQERRDFLRRLRECAPAGMKPALKEAWYRATLQERRGFRAGLRRLDPELLDALGLTSADTRGLPS